VIGSHAAIPRQSHEFGPFGAAALTTGGHRSPDASEEISTHGSFDYIPRPRSVLARLVRLINTAILGAPHSL